MVTAGVKGIGRARTGIIRNAETFIDTSDGNAYPFSNFACSANPVNLKRGQRTSWKKNHLENR